MVEHSHWEVLPEEAARLHVRALVVVRFFSGYRRTDDIHAILDHITLQNGTRVFALSLDLCMQRQTGNLATHQSLLWGKERIYGGQIVAAGGGPPCETYIYSSTDS